MDDHQITNEMGGGGSMSIHVHAYGYARTGDPHPYCLYAGTHPGTRTHPSSWRRPPRAPRPPACRRSRTGLMKKVCVCVRACVIITDGRSKTLDLAAAQVESIRPTNYKTLRSHVHHTSPPLHCTFSFPGSNPASRHHSFPAPAPSSSASRRCVSSAGGTRRMPSTVRRGGW